MQNTTTNTLKIFLLSFTFFSVMIINAQTEKPENRVSNLKKLDISDGVSLHIISPEPIQFVDLSTANLTGDLPAENIARIKITDSSETDSTSIQKKINKNNLGIITVVCQSFMAQYKVNFIDGERGNPVTNIQIQPEDMQPLEYPKMAISKTE